MAVVPVCATFWGGGFAAEAQQCLEPASSVFEALIQDDMGQSQCGPWGTIGFDNLESSIRDTCISNYGDERLNFSSVVVMICETGNGATVGGTIGGEINLSFRMLLDGCQLEESSVEKDVDVRRTGTGQLIPVDLILAGFPSDAAVAAELRNALRENCALLTPLVQGSR